MRYYGIVGKSIQIINETISPECPDGYIEMKDERPSPAHIASDTGDWILIEPQPEVTANEADTENAS